MEFDSIILLLPPDPPTPLPSGWKSVSHVLHCKTSESVCSVVQTRLQTALKIHNIKIPIYAGIIWMFKNASESERLLTGFFFFFFLWRGGGGGGGGGSWISWRIFRYVVNIKRDTKPIHRLTFGNVVLEEKPHHKHLGITLYNNCTWDEQISNISSTANNYAH